MKVSATPTALELIEDLKEITIDKIKTYMCLMQKIN